MLVASLVVVVVLLFSSFFFFLRFGERREATLLVSLGKKGMFPFLFLFRFCCCAAAANGEGQLSCPGIARNHLLQSNTPRTHGCRKMGV